MKLFSVKRVFLAAAVFMCGTLGSVEWSESDGPSVGSIRGDFTVTTSTASAGEASGLVRRASCTLVRFYVAKYSAPAAEAWVRSKGRQTQIFRPLGAVSRLNKLHRSAMRRIAPFDPP